MEKIAPYLVNFAFFADAITIPLLSLFLNFQMHRWQAQGLLNNYRVKLQRIRKSYYKLNIYLVFTPAQAKTLQTKLITQALETIQPNQLLNLFLQP
jgi:hypothetical protein